MIYNYTSNDNDLKKFNIKMEKINNNINNQQIMKKLVILITLLYLLSLTISFVIIFKTFTKTEKNTSLFKKVNITNDTNMVEDYLSKLSDGITLSNENIEYLASVDPIPPNDINDKLALRKYKMKMVLKEYALLNTLKCVPITLVFTIESLLDEITKLDMINSKYLNDLRNHLIPYQKVVLKRCSPQYSYCADIYERKKCLPLKEEFRKKKKIYFKIYQNDMIDKKKIIAIIDSNMIIALDVYEDEYCSCQ